MNNNDFIEKYITTKDYRGAYSHLMCRHDELVNYSTTLCILDREHKKARVNARKYSVTTSKIQSRLIYLLNRNGFTVEEYKGAPAIYWHYGYTGAPTLTIKDTKNI